jgi:hypothetical protein
MRQLHDTLLRRSRRLATVRLRDCLKMVFLSLGVKKTAHRVELTEINGENIHVVSPCVWG